MSNGACEGCNCGRSEQLQQEGDIPVDRPERSFTAPADAVPYEGVEPAVPLRSKQWFNDPSDPGEYPGRWCVNEADSQLGMSALYLERYMNFGITLDELRPKNRPIIGIAQTGSDLSPCNRGHMELAKRVRDGIIANGGTPFEFPCHPIQETGKRPTASLDRNLSYLSLVEVLFGYPIDGVVLLTGCDKT